MSHSEYTLQDMYGTTRRALAFYDNQMLDCINGEMQRFIASQEMMFIATADASGNCDNSFRAGNSGFVRVLDETTLIYPEYRGNGVMASLGNIYENPHISLLFIDFFTHHIGLHVNGRADIIEVDQLHDYCDAKTISDIMEEEDGRAERFVVIQVDEAYIHCSKHIPHLEKRSGPLDQKKGGDFFNARRKKDM
ncbi:pyridoxamine 5'-phosphate oxidase family protein [Salinicoccus jeotgali]|uniref:Pyridoxamine 5'-phosphate oxidase family protein n=1 Tax=Salinicoccus jeotgali TaxID=381634 RepID=A0ABP7F536_9STAP